MKPAAAGLAALLLTACASLPRQIDEACASTDESRSKSAECAGAVAYHGGGEAFKAWNIIDLIGFLAH